MGKLDGKVALVTGGGTGIGRAASLLFATEGADVAVNYSRSEDDANKTCADIEALGHKAIAVKADVSDDSAVREMVDRVVDELGRLDILVNSAGMTRFVPLDDLENLTEEDWDRAMAVNVKGAFFAARAAIPKMKESGGGSIVNVASISGISGKGSSIAYSASKAALICLTNSLATSQAPDIQVNAISPGFVDTRWGIGWDAFRKLHLEATPMGRVATGEDCADAILGLILSPFVTGENLIVDGGRSI